MGNGSGRRIGGVGEWETAVIAGLEEWGNFERQWSRVRGGGWEIKLGRKKYCVLTSR